MKHWIVIIGLFCSFPLAAQSSDEPDYFIFSIYFGGGRYHIDDQQSDKLLTWLNGISDLDMYQISIHSHTDDIGSKEYNAFLSYMRGQAALQQLVTYGIPSERISIEDFGEFNPVYDNSTWEGRLKNRRVDIIIRPLPL
ncbi:MAG: OmpA family protein [Saprospiraceae bacterium]|jgi:outer membrane protein OmpA-like peptidoglycan-associated protein|nr:OmpA family protein [Saprospiraceae bacterium]MDP4999980.1 OmpA family protein [Saprospiraceae bacterium]